MLWVDQAVQAGARKSAACLCLELPLRTLERWEKAPQKVDGRKGSQRAISHALSAKEKEQMLKIANSPEYRDLSPSKFVPLLADKGRFLASESSFYRVLKAARQLAHRNRSKPCRHYTKLAPLNANAPNKVWSWDISYLRTTIRGVYFYLYLHVDLYSRRIMGAEVFDTENSENAADLARKIMTEHQIKPQSLVLHSDNGASMKGATMLCTLQKLGVIPSFSRPGVSDDNPFSESLFKTLKYHPSYPEKPFTSLAEAQAWVSRFVRWYNTQHLHSGIEYVTPESRYQGRDKEILERRKETYAQARALKPERWKGPTRAWNFLEATELLARKDLWKEIC